MKRKQVSFRSGSHLRPEKNIKSSATARESASLPMPACSSTRPSREKNKRRLECLQVFLRRLKPTLKSYRTPSFAWLGYPEMIIQRSLLGLIFFAGSISANAARDGHKLVIQTDPYTHLKTAALTGIPTEACKGDPSLALGGDVVSIILGASQDKDGTVNYWFTTETFLRNSPLLLVQGGRLNVLIDGKEAEFTTPNGSSIQRYPSPFGGSLVETITFKIGEKDLEDISHASLLQFRVEGHRNIQRCASKKNLSHGQELIEKLPELEKRDQARQ